MIELLYRQTVCFTGHRVLPPESEAAIRDATEDAARDAIMQGYDTFLVGGALGYDTLAQLTVLRLRRDFPYLRIVMAIPCRDQDARWDERDQRMYRTLCRLSDDRVVLQERYDERCMLARNRFMVEHSSRCIACWSGSVRGGTAYTVRLARRRGLPIVNVWQG